MEKTKVYIMHSSHLDLYWIGAQADCLAKGAHILDAALRRAEKEPEFHFLIETARFLEYFAHVFPERMPMLRAAFDRGQFEMAACYTDRLENHVSGEALVRNALYGKKIIREILGRDCRVACHPDLPGFAEQTPQIYKKAGIDYYISARGFRRGARFHWLGLDDSDIIMYDVPSHYAYYDLDDVLQNLRETQEKIGSDVILLGCSAGDMGPAGTFIAKENGKAVQYDVMELVEKLNAEHPECSFAMGNAYEVLEGMKTEGLISLRGEYPSRWGHHGSAMNVAFYELDKQVDQKLTDAEKLVALCAALGNPIEIAFDRHPLKDPGGNGGHRRYFDLEFTPKTTKEWIEYAWRLQMITQDHNFGGVEGAQTEFDRLIYKKAALKIADALIQKCAAVLAARAKCGNDEIIAMNTLNWTRDSVLLLDGLKLDPQQSYVMEDGEGSTEPVIRHNESWYALARGVPSMGYKGFRIRPGKVDATQTFAVEDTAETLTVSNAFYRLTVSKRTGCLTHAIDLATGMNWASEDVLDLYALLDDSLGGSERSAVKQELDRASRHVRSVRLTACNALFAEVQIECEVMDVKLYKVLRLLAREKRVDLSIAFNWPGTPDVQLKMNLCGRKADSRILYGVPYGVQEYGTYLETDSLKFGNDEISAELFHRYREMQGFFAVEQDGDFLTVASTQSAMDFLPGGAQVLLLRDVRNGAEQDYRFTNWGKRRYEFAFVSGQGGWEGAWRMPWEFMRPMLCWTAPEKTDETASCKQESFLSTGGEGVLSVLAPEENGDWIARIYNPTIQEYILDWRAFGKPVQPTAVNLDGSPCADAPQILKGFEIKTVLISRKDGREA